LYIQRTETDQQLYYDRTIDYLSNTLKDNLDELSYLFNIQYEIVIYNI